VEKLRQTCQRIDGRGYKAYQDLRGEYVFPEFRLIVDHVQGDPFARPSRLRVRVSRDAAAFPERCFRNRSSVVALGDYLARRFGMECRRFSERRGTGKSGEISIIRPGQEILDRSSVRVEDRHVEVRFSVGLPAQGRRVLGRAAAGMLCEDLPQIVTRSLFFGSLDANEIDEHLQTNEDADELRNQLGGADLVAFVEDGAVLPRRSGVDDRPMREGRVVAFRSPETLRVSLSLPEGRTVSGMGVPKGVTLIVGGGFHGKSTLLSALEAGIYNHVPDDGRQRVVTDPTAFKIRAEDGRRIEKVGIDPFITHLPFNRDTERFCTDDASGSTSQAANIIEALEVGTRLLLVDEDTSATNFMIRDHRMQELILKAHEPIVPFVDKVRQLYQDYETSTVLVMGGSGDYFESADTVIAMESYSPRDVTAQAREIALKYAAERTPEGGDGFGTVRARVPVRGSLDPSKGRRDVKIGARGLKTILFGKHTIDLSAVEQLVDAAQLNAIGQALYFAREKFMSGDHSVGEIVHAVEEAIHQDGLDAIDPRRSGEYAAFRALELAAALNRLRTLKIK
jgi:predicted ABC-class ATPase